MGTKICKANDTDERSIKDLNINKESFQFLHVKLNKIYLLGYRKRRIWKSLES